MWDPLKTLKKLGKNFGLLALSGVAAVMTPDAVAIAAAPLGLFAPLATLGVAAAIVAYQDWLKHRT